MAVGSTFACHYFKFYADIPTSLIGLAVVFPIVFSISAAYRRREEALKYFGGLKAHMVALYYVHRDWVPGDPDKKSAHVQNIRKRIAELMDSVYNYLRKRGREEKALHATFRSFSQLSGSLEELRQAGVSNSEISRANQYLSKMMIDFERMRNIAEYRTPLTLRAYSRVFLNLFPIAFGPYFAYLSMKSEAFPYVGYMVAVLYSLVLVTLDNLQEDLEDPYDQVGSDDVQLNVMDTYRVMLED
jgi:predicted membrane chloride channel (bestrophin family)